MSEKALTINLPETLHKRLVEKAEASNRPLESLIVDFIQHCLEEGEKEESAPEKSPGMRELEALKRTGLVNESWGKVWGEFLASAPREMLAGLAPLNETKVADTSALVKRYIT
ncbi:MAG: hypothetical protein ACUVV0_13215 [Anaerolineae bacterium]